MKTDLINEVISQRKFIVTLKDDLLILQSSSDLRDSFLDFLKANESFGFFYIRNILSKIVIVFDLIKEIMIENQSIKNAIDFLEHIRNQGASFSIESNIIFKDTLIRKMLINEVLPVYFKSKEDFEKEVIKFNSFYKIFNACYNLKIFNLQSIRMITQNESLLDTIFKSKEKKLSSSYESFELSKITYQLIENKLDDFLNNIPPVIKPNLGTSIPPSSGEYFALLLKNNVETVENLKKVSYITKRWSSISDNLIYFALFLPYLNSEEKGIFISIFKNLFKENLVSVKRYVFSGLQRAYSRKDFFDLEQKEFFYTKDLFGQYFSNVRTLLGDVQYPLLEAKTIRQSDFWSTSNKLTLLINAVDDRIKAEHINLSISESQSLLKFHEKLEESILDLNDYKNSQEKFFFKNSKILD